MHMFTSMRACEYRYTHTHSHIYLEAIEWLFSYGPQYLTLECNIGLRRRQKAILARARSARANTAREWSSGPILHSLVKHGGPCAKCHCIISSL